MKLKALVIGAACGALFLITPLAFAGSGSLNQFRHHALPVLVSVNSHGKVTNMQPAYEVAPPVRRALKASLQQMITGPATTKGGKGVSSQAIIQLAVVPTRRDDGKYDVRFEYVKATPVPSGSWFWNHINGHRLALESDDGRTVRHYRRHHRYIRARPIYRVRPKTAPRHRSPRPAARPMPTRHAAPMQRVAPRRAHVHPSH